MVDKTAIESIVNDIRTFTQNTSPLYQKDTPENRPFKKNVVLFFSFDVVNSTLYKTINYYGWAQVLNLLFKELRKKVCNKIEGSEMWRVLGDEAIFIIKIRDEEELINYVNTIFEIMVSTISEIKSGKFLKSDNDFELMKLQNILSLKAAAWIAIVTDVGDITDKNISYRDTDNIFERYKSQEGYEIFEFLGNDIDTGFRIATQTQDGRMVLSYELAYLISQKTEVLSHLNIITYKKLKGVWKNKLYPIIWYHNSKTYLDVCSREIPLEDSFSFDECDENELIKEYYDNRKHDKDNKIIHDIRMYTEPYFALKKILLDRGLSEKIEIFHNLIKTSTHDQTKYIDTSKMQIHCAAVCFKKDMDGIKILVAKRSESKKRFSGQWEFGCVKAVSDKTISQKLIEDYKKDFNINIKPVIDKNREIKEPIPIALYSVNHGDSSTRNGQDKGIITLAEIIGNYEPGAFQKTLKHEKLQWVTEKDLPNIDKLFETCIPDFKSTLIIAFERIKSLDGGNQGDY